MSHTKHKSKMVSHETSSTIHRNVSTSHINNPTLSRLMNIIFDKCQEFVQEIPIVLAKFDLPQHRYNTRSQTQKRQKQEQVIQFLKRLFDFAELSKSMICNKYILI